MAVVLTAGAALMVGFLTGLLSFKVKTRWCPGCGSLMPAAIPERGSARE
jgi:hypothetical protein